MKRFVIGGFVALFALAGCGAVDQVELVKDQLWAVRQWDQPSRKENRENYKVGNPYRVFGKWYYPKEQPDYKETGMASWYGPGFHNRLTANGEVYDKYKYTAAHLTLPMPSIVKVTNLENGKSIYVRVNDRGPFKRGRIIDMSYAGAKKLGFDKKGTAKVRVEFDKEKTHALFYDSPAEPKKLPKRELASHVKSPKLTTVDAALQGGGDEYFVQTGAYQSTDNAYVAEDQLRKLGKTRVFETSLHGKRYHRVQLGPFTSEKEADKVLEQVRAVGFSDAIIVAD